MKIKDIKALHQKNIAELEKDYEKKHTEMVKLMLESKMKPSKNNRILSTIKDDIARIMTVIKELKLKESIKK